MSRPQYSQEQITLNIYLFYRIVTALLLLGLFYIRLSSFENSEVNDGSLYFGSAITYLAITVFNALSIVRAAHINTNRIFIYVLVDILFLTVLAYSNGSMNTTFSILLMSSIAAGGIMITGRLATLLAAIATIAVIYQQFYFALKHVHSYNNLLEAAESGILGIAFFTVSILSQQLAKQLRLSKEFSAKQGEKLTTLKNLNQHIIQHMEMGVIVVKESGKTLLINSAAKRLLSIERDEKELNSISNTLNNYHQKWCLGSKHFPPFKNNNQATEVRASFSHIADTNTAIIYIEDNVQLIKHAQQLKLASLGRLTAGIAHEIRNPLGAISHASQLLKESEQLTPADSRLSDIIQQHAIRMNQIIDNILQLSRRKQSARQTVDLSQSLLNFKQQFEETKDQDITFELTYNAKPAILFDERQLHQILTNLCENAIRHSAKSTKQHYVLLETIQDKDSTQVILKIKDLGAGVAEENLTHLFEPFFTTESGGTGLGLYLAKELCEANQAQLDYIVNGDEKSFFQIAFNDRLDSSELANIGAELSDR